MKATQAINLLENGIMPCVLSQLNGTNKIEYICGYSFLSPSAPRVRGGIPSIIPQLYQFITLNENYFYADSLNDEIYSGGGGEL